MTYPDNNAINSDDDDLHPEAESSMLSHEKQNERIFVLVLFPDTDLVDS